MGPEDGYNGLKMSLIMRAWGKRLAKVCDLLLTLAVGIEN
jgi:hypothetical protein